MPRPKFWAAITAAVAVTMGMSLTAPTDARADRCNPDEMIAPIYTLVTDQPYEPVFGEDDGPFCYAMKTAVYPAIGCDPALQSLMQCVQSQPNRTLTILSGVCKETADEVDETFVLGYQPTLGRVAQLCYAMTESACNVPLESPEACVLALQDRVRALFYPCYGYGSTNSSCPCYYSSCPDPAPET